MAGKRKPKPRGAARAAELEAEIDKLARPPSKTAAGPGGSGKATDKPTSARDFVQKRMAELGAKKGV